MTSVAKSSARLTYQLIIEHYERCLAEFGDTHKGVNWPNAESAIKRHDVMLGVIRDPFMTVTLLDYGCGTGHLLETVQARGETRIKYTGADISTRAISLCKDKFPTHSFYCLDILEQPLRETFDYIICNGVFTVKLGLPHAEMFDYVIKVVTALWTRCSKGIAFNLMSKHVDWESEDLFYVCFDELATFCKAQLSRHFVLRADYALHEYTAYVYKIASNQ
jgi:2-polyprenyl-3-methyl-5-hydroxy-6-metoxy-1,4-benzoquinol methylase